MKTVIRSHIIGALFMLSNLSNAASPPWNSPAEAFQDEKVGLLVEAAMQKDAARVSQLKREGADIDAVGKLGVTPLLWATLKQDDHAVALLLQAGADPNKYVHIPNGTEGLPPALWTAAAGGMNTILTMMLRHGADANQTYNSRSLLTAAIRYQHSDTARILFDHGADINFPRTGAGLTALEAAIFAKDYKTAIWVLNNGYSKELSRVQNVVSADTSQLTAEQERYKAELARMLDERSGAKHR